MHVLQHLVMMPVSGSGIQELLSLNVKLLWIRGIFFLTNLNNLFSLLILAQEPVIIDRSCRGNKPRDIDSDTYQCGAGLAL
jgi:hypothetical protein